MNHIITIVIDFCKHRLEAAFDDNQDTPRGMGCLNYSLEINVTWESGNRLVILSSSINRVSHRTTTDIWKL